MSTAIRPEFRSFLPKSAVLDNVQFVPSPAGPDEALPEEMFRAMGTGVSTPQLDKLLTNLSQMTPSQRDLMSHLTDSVKAAWPDEIVPTGVESGQNGVFKVELKRVGKSYNDIPETGPQETRAFLYVDPTPGEDGMTVYTEMVNPAPSTRPLFAAQGVKNTEMESCHPDSPVKTALLEVLDLTTRYVQADVTGDLAAMQAIEERAGDQPTPELKAAGIFLKKAQKNAFGDTPWLTPVSMTDHGNGIFSLKMQEYFPSSAMRDKPTGSLGEEHGTLWIDTRPGLPGLESGT